MENSKKISVVLPIYNVEQYLRECLNSVVNQSYKNIEILLVDDGSPDSSGEICDKYADKDSRIKVYHIPNGGAAKARQYGVENSTGEYILFVDPDDFIPDNAIELLISALCSDTDIVIGSHTRFYDNNVYFNYTIKQQQYINTEFLRSLLIGNIISSPWAKLIKKELFTQYSFPSLKRGEDLLMNVDLACRAENVVVISNNVYFYRAESESSSICNFRYTFEFCKEQSFILKEILTRSGLFDRLKFEYSIASLDILFKAVKSNEYFDKNDPLILSVKKELKGKSLSMSTRIILLSFNCDSLRRLISFVYRNIRSGRMILFRKLIKKVFNK